MNHIRRSKTSIKKRIIVRRSVRSMFGRTNIRPVKNGLKSRDVTNTPAPSSDTTPLYRSQPPLPEHSLLLLFPTVIYFVSSPSTPHATSPSLLLAPRLRLEPAVNTSLPARHGRTPVARTPGKATCPGGRACDVRAAFGGTPGPLGAV